MPLKPPARRAPAHSSDERKSPLTDSCRVVPYASEHRTLVAELQRHLWSPDTRLNASYLEWKYHQNPYIREPLIYLAFMNDELVGMRGAFGSLWEIGGRPQSFTLPYPDDLVVHPAYRRRGLHRVIMSFALRDLARRGYRYLVNLSASRITTHASMKMRWRNGGKVDTVRRRTPSKAARDFLADRAKTLPLVWRWADDIAERGGRFGESLFERFDANTSAQSRWPRIGTLSAQSTPRINEMSRLIARLPWDGRIRHVRDETFIGWRYKNPLRCYRFLYAGEERLRGYIVLQSAEGIADRVNVVDWEAEDDVTQIELLSAAIRFGRFSEICLWRLGATPAAVQCMRRHGFRSAGSQHEHSVLTRSVSDEELEASWVIGGRRIDDAEQWDMRMIYSMIG